MTGIIKGGSCKGAARLAAHLLRQDHNELVRLVELRGSTASDLRGTLADMEAMAVGTACKLPLFHASINTRLEKKLSDDQRSAAIDRLESALGLNGQPRAVVIHQKLGRGHTHVVRPSLVLNEPDADSGDAAAQERDGLLDSIAREVKRRTVTICDGIAAEFAARIRAVRKTVPKEQLAGLIRALKQARREAVRFARESAAVELAARQKGVGDD